MKYGMEAGGGPVFHKTLPSHGYKPYQKPPYAPHSSYSSLPNPGIQCANDFAQYKEPLIGKNSKSVMHTVFENSPYSHFICNRLLSINVFSGLVRIFTSFSRQIPKYPTHQGFLQNVRKKFKLCGVLLRIMQRKLQIM